MSAADGFVTTPVVSPLSFVEFNDPGDSKPIWFVYMFGDRVGSVQFGQHTCYYRSREYAKNGRLFASFGELTRELERCAALVAIANAHLIGDTAKAAA